MSKEHGAMWASWTNDPDPEADLPYEERRHYSLDPPEEKYGEWTEKELQQRKEALEH